MGGLIDEVIDGGIIIELPLPLDDPTLEEPEYNTLRETTEERERYDDFLEELSIAL